MVLYLGLDGGGTGCRAAVADGGGPILGHGSAGPANVASDAEGARAAILQAATAALHEAFGHARDMGDVHAGLGLAGANAAGVIAPLRLSLPFASARIETDAVTATKGALGTRDGIVAAIGTGSVFTVQKDGLIRQFGGWGLVLGDEGSGARMGRAALSLALRAVDGFAPMSPFLEGLIARFGGPGGVVTFARTARPSDFAALMPDLLRSADPAARHVISHAVAEVEAVLLHLRRTSDLAVTFIGGLGPTFASRLPNLPQVEAMGTALDGALMLAREER